MNLYNGYEYGERIKNSGKTIHINYYGIFLASFHLL